MARSLRARLALALGLTAALSLAASAVITFALVRRYTQQQAVADLRSFAEALASQSGTDDIEADLARPAMRRLVTLSGNLVAVVGPRGGARAITSGAREVAERIDLSAVLAGREIEGSVDTGQQRYAYVALPSTARNGLVSGVVLARPIGLAEDAWGPIIARVLLGAGIAAALAALASTVLARRLVRPVRRVSEATARVASGDLGGRVPVEGHDELAGLARSFNSMSLALAEARRREGEFLASVSHELRTPLTAMRGYVEALDEGAVRDAKGRAEALAVIKTETARLERLVRDVMDLARLDAQEFRLEVREADLARVLHEAASAHRAQAGEAGVSLLVEAPETMGCRTDPDRVRQVVTNLVENAVRMTPRGGSVRLAGREASPATFEVVVSDTGPGIAPEHLPHVFERAYLRTVSAGDGGGDGARAEAGRLAPGSGLGLAIVRELVRALGGTIDVTSEQGRGTTFRVSLPRTA